MLTSIKICYFLPYCSPIVAFEGLLVCIFEEDFPKISLPDQKKIKPVSKALLLDSCFISCLYQVCGLVSMYLLSHPSPLREELTSHHSVSLM